MNQQTLLNSKPDNITYCVKKGDTIILENVSIDLAEIFISKIEENQRYEYRIEASMPSGIHLLHD